MTVKSKSMHVRWRDTLAMYLSYWTGLDIIFLPLSGIITFLTEFLYRKLKQANVLD